MIPPEHPFPVVGCLIEPLRGPRSPRNSTSMPDRSSPQRIHRAVTAFAFRTWRWTMCSPCWYTTAVTSELPPSCARNALSVDTRDCLRQVHLVPVRPEVGGCSKRPRAAWIQDVMRDGECAFTRMCPMFDAHRPVEEWVVPARRRCRHAPRGLRHSTVRRPHRR